MTRADQVLDPAAAAIKSERERVKRERRRAKQRDIYSRLLDNPDFRLHLIDQAAICRYGRTPPYDETDFTRGARAAFTSLLMRIVGLTGDKGEAFMVEWARQFAKLCREQYTDKPEE